MIKIISKHGSFLSCALHMYEDGESIKVYIDEEPARKVFEGMIPKVSDMAALDIKPNDVIVVDMVGFGEGADVISKTATVLCASSVADKMELDRKLGFDLMKKSGILLPKSKQFNSFEDAAAFVSETKGRYVFKPDGNLNTSLTYVSTSHVNMLAMLPYLEKKCGDKPTFELQEFVPGIEMSTEMWFNGKQFIHPANSTMEEKKLFPGNHGPNTGCMGNIVWCWDMETSKTIYEKMFKGLESYLKNKYIGPIDINAIWTDKGPYGLEFTARFGYDAIQAFDQLLNIPMQDFLRSLKEMKELPVDADPNKYAAAVRVSIPPFPHSVDDVPEVPILGITKNIKKNLYLSDVCLKDDGLQTAGYDGYIFTVADYGSNINRLVNHLYKIIDILEIPNKQYRNDIGDRVPKEKSEIEKIIKKL